MASHRVGREGWGSLGLAIFSITRAEGTGDGEGRIYWGRRARRRSPGRRVVTGNVAVHAKALQAYQICSKSNTKVAHDNGSRCVRTGLVGIKLMLADLDHPTLMQ